MRCPGNLSNAVKLKHIDYWVSASELSLNLCVSSEAWSRLLSHRAVSIFHKYSHCPFS